ncbi:hypothetical protein [Mycolicibacterium doricum]|uniref:hypothetical protein n=1 Tax=Mycolicibacterium doricum TaxID=126673 RepID=UPI001056C454|nr:hypothetical protein [Mycolicibacterium doricum]MCV7268660.1 hypothetical protein [Mycolicibacterium doricum]
MNGQRSVLRIGDRVVYAGQCPRFTDDPAEMSAQFGDADARQRRIDNRLAPGLVTAPNISIQPSS